MDALNLKEYRKSLDVTIKEASEKIGISERTFSWYLNDDNYGDVLKRKGIFESLKENFEITETKGLLSIDKIKKIVSDVLEDYKESVDFCYLFGSYAKGYATEKSDVDLLVATSLTGFAFVGLIEKLRVALHKNVDLLRLNDIKENYKLLKEILQDGIRIYG